MKGSIILVLHIDDVIIIAKYAIDIENLLTSLKEGTDIDTGITKTNLKKFSFTDDRVIKIFLGVKVEKTNNGFHLSQNHLINKIFETVDLYIEESFGRNNKDTPVVKLLFLKDKTGDEITLPWNYRSFVGILNYLASSTHPDISMAVHQVV